MVDRFGIPSSPISVQPVGGRCVKYCVRSARYPTGPQLTKSAMQPVPLDFFLIGRLEHLLIMSRAGRSIQLFDELAGAGRGIGSNVFPICSWICLRNSSGAET